jgi:hypothetical protein
MSNKEVYFAQPRLELLSVLSDIIEHGWEEVYEKWDFIEEFFLMDLESGNSERNQKLLGILYIDKREIKIIEQIGQIIDDIGGDWNLDMSHVTKIQNLAMEFFNINHNKEILNLRLELTSILTCGKSYLKDQWASIKNLCFNFLKVNKPKEHRRFIGIIYEDEQEAEIIEKIGAILNEVENTNELDTIRSERIVNLTKKFFNYNNNAEIYNIDKEDLK